MKSMTKRTGAILAAAALATTFGAAGAMLLHGNAYAAEEEKNEGLTYFYDKLGEDEAAKKFYDTFKTLTKNGTFKTGELQYNLVDNGVVTANRVAEYVNSGDKHIPEAYGAGRDSFIMDNPDLFYIDVFGTSISAGTKGNDYVALLDSSRVKTLYLGDLNSEKKIEDAIIEYENKLSEIVTAAKAAGDTKAQIEYVNEYMCNNVEYTFGVDVIDGHNVDTPAAAYINTAYGALVNGKAICGGYSKGFKAVMDRLGIPCVCIQGYNVKEDGSSEAHMWNTVKLEGMWYNVDVTWNGANPDHEKWLLLGSRNFGYSHEEDNVISSSGYELDFPAVKPYDYGVNSDDNRMDIEGEYTASPSGTGKTLTLTVSYEGKGGEKLEEDGKYLAFRMGNVIDGETVWGDYWYSATAFNTVFSPIWTFTDTDSKIKIEANNQFVQFALMSRAPEESMGAFYPDGHENAGQPFNYLYVTENLKNSDFVVQPSIPYENDGHNSYIPAPWGNSTPSNTGDLPVNATYDIKITYTQSLEIITPGDEIKMSFTASRGNEEAQKNAVVSDFAWDGDKVITFKFTPSKMYINNLADYYFVPTNLQGVRSKKVPDPVRYCFKGKSVVCSKVFNDGRLYMNVFGQAELLDTSDLSVTDFKDDDGNYFAESQRSQLMLVVNKPSQERENEMKDVLMDETSLEQKDIVSSATYEIDLSICGGVREIPNGSYLQVAFGFPEGYSPNDAGTTFKIYHYKHDKAGNITGVEEIPVIITQYGLIAKVSSFSPFTVVQVKNSSAAVTESKKAVYASANGNGTVKTTDGNSGISLVENDSITYNITADEGYEIAHVLLNGKAVDASRYENGTITLTADELEAGNTLEASFITKEAAKSYADMGVKLAAIEQTILPTYSDGPNVGLIVGCVLGAVVVVAGATVAIVLLRKRNKTNK